MCSDEVYVIDLSRYPDKVVFDVMRYIWYDDEIDAVEEDLKFYHTVAGRLGIRTITDTCMHAFADINAVTALRRWDAAVYCGLDDIAHEA